MSVVEASHSAALNHIRDDGRLGARSGPTTLFDSGGSAARRVGQKNAKRSTILLLASMLGSQTFAATLQGPLDRQEAVSNVQPSNGDARESSYDDSLADAIVEAYVSNPLLGAQRYEQRAVDDGLGIALAQGRPTAQFQVQGGYEITYPGDATQATRPLVDRLNNPEIQRNDLQSQLAIDQPLLTGGRLSAAIDVARAEILAGRATLQGREGDLILEVIASYADVRRDKATVAVRERNVADLERTLAEIKARRTAGELTRTDIAQGETQLRAAQVQLNLVRAQLETSRSSFTALVGRPPGSLAPEPALTSVSFSIDETFARAQENNPDITAAIASELASRGRIALAKANGAPSLTLRGTAGTSGQLAPFSRRDQDVSLAGRATLTIPLSAGGLIRSQVAQARNRNSADQLRIEATRRQTAQRIVSAWNQWVTASANAQTQANQFASASTLYEGTFAEYREGLRSTFDVLFAQNALRDSEIALLSSRRDAYVAQASLLRQVGELELARLLKDAQPYDPAVYTRRAQVRSSLPWDRPLRALDRLTKPSNRPQAGALLVPPSDAAHEPEGGSTIPPPVLVTPVSAVSARLVDPVNGQDQQP